MEYLLHQQEVIVIIIAKLTQQGIPLQLSFVRISVAAIVTVMLLVLEMPTQANSITKMKAKDSTHSSCFSTIITTGTHTYLGC